MRFRGVACGQFPIPWMHRARLRSPSWKSFYQRRLAAGFQYFLLRVHRLSRRFAQVIHMLMGTAGQQCCCRACVTRRHAGR